MIYKSHTEIKKILFTAIFIFVILNTVFSITAYADPGFPGTSHSPVELIEGWQYQWGDSPVNEKDIPLWVYGDNGSSNWKNFNYKDKPFNMYGHKNMWIRIKLPQEIIKEPSFFIGVEDQIFDVYLEDKLIYKFGEATMDSEPGSRWHIISLPQDFQGKSLYFKLHSNHIAKLGVFYSPQLGSKSDHILRIVKDGIEYFIFSFIYFFIGISLIFIYLVRKKDQKAYLSLGFFSICVSVWLITISELIHLFINAPGILYYVYTIALYLMPAGICSFVVQIFNWHSKRFIRNLSKVYFIYTVLALLLDSVNILPIYLTVVPFYFLLIITIIVLVFMIIKEAFLGNLEAKIFAIGFAPLALAAFYDIFGGYFRIILWWHNTVHFGMFIFTVSLIIILARNFANIRNKLDDFSKEIEYKNATLNEREKLLIEAKEYDRIKTEFFANISHELRTPLSINLCTLQLLKLYLEDGSINDSDGSIVKYIKTMQQNCNRLLRLVNNIIDVTKIDSGYLELNLEDQNIVNVVEEITLSVADFIKSKGVNFCFDTDIEEKVIACDPDMIERIILNLLSNAVKFTEPGGDITVTIEDKDENIIISVSDTGIGIPEDKLGIIFERFRQVDKSLTRKHEGSGIGLSLVKSLVKMHGGNINVESTYGKGSKFIIELPAKKLSDKDYAGDIDANLKQYHVEKINIEFSDL